MLLFINIWWCGTNPTRGSGPKRSGSGSPEALAGLLGEWETMVGERQRDTPCRESLGIEFTWSYLVGYGGKGKGSKGSHGGRRERDSSYFYNLKNVGVSQAGSQSSR